MIEKTPQIILASQSPRRKKLMEYLKVDFVVKASHLAEIPPMGDLPNSYATRMALEKALKIAQSNPNDVIVAADTVVALEDQIMGKPKSLNEANLMLSQLSGKWHEVWTGLCVIYMPTKFQALRAVRSKVLFRNLSLEEIEKYVSSGEPMDKAGAYAVQGLGRTLVKEIKGSYHNIIGLPTFELGKILDKLGITIDSSSVETLG